MNEAPAPEPRYSPIVTGLLAVLLLAMIGVSVARPTDDSEELERPVATAVRVHEQMLSLGAVNGQGWWAWLRGWSVDLPADPAGEALLAYQQTITTKGVDVRAGAPLHARRAVLLAHAGRAAEAREAVAAAERADPSTTSTLGKVLGYGMLAQPGEPTAVEVDSAVAALAVPGFGSEGWTADELRLSVHRRRGDTDQASAIQAGMYQRTRRLLRGSEVLAGVGLLAAAVALALIILAATRGRRLLPWPPQLSNALLPPPWTVGQGVAVAVRALVTGMMVGGISYVVLERLGFEGTGVAFIAAGIPGYRYIRRGLLTPAGLDWRSAFGLRAPGQFRRVLGCTAMLVAIDQVMAMLAQISGARLGRQVPWTDLMNETVVTGARWPAAAMILAMVVAAPLMEEVFFRGVIYGTLRRRLPVLAAAMVSGLLFAVAHGYSLVATTHLFLGATIWALAYEWTRSLLPSLLDHATNNVLAGTGDLLLR